MDTHEFLNNIDYGEKFVEIKGIAVCKDRDDVITVYSVTIYTCKKEVIEHLFRKDEECKKFEKYTIPFYFLTKELAEEFMEYYDLFSIKKLTYWKDRDIQCYGISIKNDPKKREIYLIDEYKTKYPKIYDHKTQLEKDGIFGGYCCIDGRYYISELEAVKFSEMIQSIRDLIIKIDNTNKVAERHIYKLQKV